MKIWYPHKSHNCIFWRIGRETKICKFNWLKWNDSPIEVSIEQSRQMILIGGKKIKRDLIGTFSFVFTTEKRAPPADVMCVCVCDWSIAMHDEINRSANSLVSNGYCSENCVLFSIYFCLEKTRISFKVHI